MSALSTAILADSPVGYWKLDEALGAGTVADSSGNGHSGTVGSLVQLGALGLGNAGKAARVNKGGGSANANISVPASSDFDLSGTAYTLEMCFRLEQDFSDQAAGHVPAYFGCQSSGAPFLRVAQNGAGAGQTYIGFKLDANGTLLGWSSGQITDTHSWHHVIATYDPAGPTIKIWLDGVDVTSGTSNQTVTAGASTVLLMPSYGETSICNCAIYKGTALSSARVAAHYSAFQTDNTPAALVPSSILWGIHNDAMYIGAGQRESLIVSDNTINARVSRFTVLWESIQPTSGGGYTWTALDAVVQDCLLADAIPLFVPHTSPTWANGGTGTNNIPGVGADATFQAFVTNFQTFIAALVDRYKPGGSGPYTVPSWMPFLIEIWNEPNQTGFWADNSANTNQQWADQYAYMYRNVRSAILAHYASAICVFAGLSSWSAGGAPNVSGQTWLPLVLGSTQWSAAPIDAFGYHPYSYQDNPDDTTSYQNHFNDVLCVANYLLSQGYTCPVYCTEFGFSSGTSESDQNTKMTTALTRIRDEWSPFVSMAVIFRTYGASSQYSIWRTMPSSGASSVDLKPAGVTFSQIASPFDYGASKTAMMMAA